MNNIFKILLIFSFAITTSCQKDDEAIIPDPPKSGSSNFFNLKTGNTWVYKRYVENCDNSLGWSKCIPYGSIDTVYIEKELMLNGSRCYKRVTKNINGNIETEIIKINKYGHLVKTNYPYNYGSEEIIHPGKIFVNANYEDVLKMKYELKPIQEIAVEGKNYKVHPFTGKSILYDNPNFESFYQENIGEVKLSFSNQDYKGLASHFNQPVKRKNDILSQIINLHEQILEMANSKPCTDPSQWKIIQIGRSSFSRFNHLLAYHQDIDVEKFMEKVSLFNTLIEENYGFEIHSVTHPLPSSIECIDDRPVFSH